MPQIKTIQIDAISKKVYDLFSSSETNGCVTAVFKNTFNIQIGKIFLANIGSNIYAPHPRSILVSKEDFNNHLAQKVRVGVSLKGCSKYFCFPELGLSLSTEYASLFIPKVEIANDILHVNEIKFNLLWGIWEATRLRGNYPGKCGSPLAGYFMSKYAKAKFDTSSSCESTFSCNMREALWYRINVFLDAVRRCSLSKISNSAREIIGLGVGLTPSGDDFLAGFVSGAVILGNTKKNLKRYSTRIAEIVCFWATSRTTDVSISMIRDASHGEVSEPAANFVKSVLQIRDPYEAAVSANQLMSIGETSGEDFLNGLACGIWSFAEAS